LIAASSAGVGSQHETMNGPCSVVTSRIGRTFHFDMSPSQSGGAPRLRVAPSIRRISIQGPTLIANTMTGSGPKCGCVIVRSA
jgi:hypothetical protein